MKNILLFTIVLIVNQVQAQDTLSRSVNQIGMQNYMIKNGVDTFIITYYKQNAKSRKVLESKRLYSQTSKTTEYLRYYPNGKTMWAKQYSKGKEDGISTYYSEKGIKMAQLKYLDGALIDTLFLTDKVRIVIGKATYYSVVYGGMENEDGSSNISGGEGVFSHQYFYTVKMNPELALQNKYKEFLTDYEGNFFLCLEKGEYGFFPNYYSIKNVKSNMGAPISEGGGSVMSSWNLTLPINMIVAGMYVVKLHFHSEGYAP